MRIENAITRLQSFTDSWMRVDQLRRIPTGVELWISVHLGRRGRKAETWRIKCLGIRDLQIADLDGGGLALYPGTHPAARRFTARQAVLRWSGGDDTTAIGALYRAHMDTVADWISFSQCLNARGIAKPALVRGPEFLMRAYAKALRRIGAQPRLSLRPKGQPRVRLRVLHFGDSYVVAATFIAQQQT